jgi:hypothetical protein
LLVGMLLTLFDVQLRMYRYGSALKESGPFERLASYMGVGLSSWFVVKKICSKDDVNALPKVEMDQ